MSEDTSKNRVVVTDEAGQVVRIKSDAEIVQENQDLEDQLKAKVEESKPEVETPQLDMEVLKKLKEKQKKEESMKAVAKRDRSLYFGVVGLGQAGCVSGDTNVYVSKYGITTIKELFYNMLNNSKLENIEVKGNKETCIKMHDKEIFTVSFDPCTGNFKKAKVTAVWKNRVVSKNKITMSNGSKIVCSKKHPSLVFRPNSRRKAFFSSLNSYKPLQIGDRLFDTRMEVLDLLSEKTEIGGVEIVPDVSWLLGMFAGDGHSKISGNEISFYSSDKGTTEKIISVVKKYIPNTSIKVTDRPGCKQIAIYGLKAKLFFNLAFGKFAQNTYGGFGTKTYTIDIPECVTSSSSDIRAAFLAGLIDADGTVSKDWCETSIFTCSKNLSDKIGCLISSIGGRSSLEVTPPRKKSKSAGYRIKLSGKLNHGPKINFITSHISHSIKKDRLMLWAKSKQKSFATSSVPLSYDEVKHWLISEGKMESSYKLYKKSGINIKSWASNKQKLSLNSFNKIMSHLNDSEQINYLNKISSNLIEIKSVESVDEGECEFFDLTVEKYENYIAGNNGLIVTHNSRLAETMYGLGYEGCVFNTAKQDLEHINLPNNKKIFLPFALGGAGKELENGRQAIEQNGELILNTLNDMFDEKQEMLVLAVSGGGGTGSGGAEALVSLMASLGKPLCVIYVLPMESEDALSKHNSVVTLSKLAKMASTDVITTLIVVDNAKIENIYPGLSKAEFWTTANNAIVEPLHLFNHLSSQSTKYDSLDPMDFGRLFTTGDCTIYGLMEVEDYMETTAIAEAVIENLEGSLLAADFDLKETRLAGFIVTANPEILQKLPAMNINYASHVISEACDSPQMVKGVYEVETDEDIVKVYTMFSGLGLPAPRVESLKEQATEQMAILRKKEKSRAAKMTVEYGATNATENMAQEVHRQIKQKKSGFGQLTRNAGKIVDRRKRDKRGR